MDLTDLDEGRHKPNFLERAKALLTRPKDVWPEIDRDMTPSGELFTRYAAPLAALAPAIGFITGRVFNWSPFHGFFSQLFTAASGYAFTLINMLLMSFIASKLAPRFGGKGSPRDAFKLIAWSSTALWLAAAAATIPGFGFLGIASFYSLYLYFTGIGPIMKVPEANKNRFGVITIACALGLNMVTAAISAGPVMLFGGNNPSHVVSHEPARQANVHDSANVDGQAIGEMFKGLSDVYRDRDLKPVSGATLQALLPEKIGDYSRTEVESTSTDGPGGSQAEATYEHDGKTFTLKLLDLASAGGFVSAGSAFGIEHSRDDEDGFEHVTMKDGGFTLEQWDRDDSAGKYTTMVAKRFMIEAEGEADSIDRLKDAVEAIAKSKLSALAE